LTEGENQHRERQAGECLEPLEFKADHEIDEENRPEHGHCDQEAEQQLLCAAGIFQRVAIDLGVRPKVPADVCGQPETVEAEGDQFQ
jgi:hypothetical protein